MSSLSLSVVVIGRNEGQRLGRCLASIQSIRGVPGPTETIYVDSQSVDGSPLLAARANARVVVLDSDKCTAALARNAGWQLTDTDLVLFLDGDTVLDPDFPRLAIDAISAHPEIAAVWGHRRETHPERSIYNRVLDLDWVVRPGFTDYCGGDVLMRRRALEEAGGYDATLIAGEEPELCRRLRQRGYRILHLDAPMTGHDLAMTRFSQYWRRALRAGHAYAEVSGRFRGTADPLWQTEHRRNLVRCAFWILSLLSATLASIVMWSPSPAVMWLGLLFVLSIRSTWKARWKSSSALTLLFYGVHSHLQQLPICMGQLAFVLRRRSRTSRGLIEYK
jgi:cellulose synthase/poly-beta-1,6-N-acetylglucosamine synthase-like glycosyltransferase